MGVLFFFDLSTYKYMKETNNHRNLPQPLTKYEQFEFFDLELKILLSLPSPTIISRYDLLKKKKEAYTQLVLKQAKYN